MQNLLSNGQGRSENRREGKSERQQQSIWYKGSSLLPEGFRFPTVIPRISAGNLKAASARLTFFCAFVAPDLRSYWSDDRRADAFPFFNTTRAVSSRVRKPLLEAFTPPLVCAYYATAEDSIASALSLTTTVSAVLGSRSPCTMRRASSVSTVCCKYRRRGRAPYCGS